MKIELVAPDKAAVSADDRVVPPAQVNRVGQIKLLIGKQAFEGVLLSEVASPVDPFQRGIDQRNTFRDAVAKLVERGNRGSVCPVLVMHHDSDGQWSPADAEALPAEPDIIEETFSKCPPVPFDSPWKKEVAKAFGIAPKNLLDCFFDVDGEPLIMRLRDLAKASLRVGEPILFQ